MDRFTRDDLKRLATADVDPAVTIYMPTYRSGREVRQNSIRFKNLLGQATQQLADYGLDEELRQTFFREAEKLTDNDGWWQHQSDGLAMFLSVEQMEKHRMPLPLDEFVSVGPRFHVRPMVRLIQNDGQFYVLAVSQNKVRLMAGTQHSMSELELEQLPSDLRSALNIDEYVSTLQHHSTGASNQPGATLFHGQGGAGMEVQKKDEIRQFFRRIDSSLGEFFGVERTPLVFAGVDYLFPLFREECSYSALVETPVTGNPDEMSADDLHPQAWKVVAPQFEAQRDLALEQYSNLSGGEKTTAVEAEVVRAARRGAIETLLLAAGQQQWGVIDEQLDSVVPCEENTDGAEELLNYAAMHTLANGGSVYSLKPEKMPNGQRFAAVLRYEPARPGV